MRRRGEMDRGWATYSMTIPEGISEFGLDQAEKAFKAGMVLMMARVCQCDTTAELEALRDRMLDESRAFMESIPCTCGRCHEHEGGNRGSR